MNRFKICSSAAWLPVTKATLAWHSLHLLAWRGWSFSCPSLWLLEASRPLHQRAQVVFPSRTGHLTAVASLHRMQNPAETSYCRDLVMPDTQTHGTLSDRTPRCLNQQGPPRKWHLPWPCLGRPEGRCEGVHIQAADGHHAEDPAWHLDFE